MKWLRNCLLVFGVLGGALAVVTPVRALEASPFTPAIILEDSPVIISAYGYSGSLNYVQLYNTADEPINLDSFTIEFATKEGSVKQLLSLKGWIAPSNYLISSFDSGVENADFMYDPGNGAMTGDVLRLSSNIYMVHEVTIDKKGLYQRKKPTRTSTFEATESPTLYGGGFYTYPTNTPLQIYEIMAHPRLCSPLDVALECNDYIKLYNPSIEVIDLSALRLRVGYKGQNATSSNSFPLSGEVLPGHYAVILQDRDGDQLSVTNSGGYVWLEDAYGVTLYDSTVQGYEDASADSRRGQAWSYDGNDGVWKWTTQPTPLDGPNVFPIILPTIEEPAVKVYTPCEPGEYRSEDTHRCRSAASLAVATLVPCKEGEERNLATGRCRKIATVVSEKPCPEGQIRNSATGRCKAKDAPMVDPGFSVEPMNSTKGRFAGWWTISGVGALAAGYGIWEWRREISKTIRKVGLFFISGV